MRRPRPPSLPSTFASPGRAALLSGALLLLPAPAWAQGEGKPAPEAAGDAPKPAAEAVHGGAATGPTPRAPAEPKAEPKPEPKLETPPPAAPAPVTEPPRPPTGFAFGSYGRMIAATDLHGRPGRDADVVAHGARLDEGNYVELELRRDDYWNVTKTGTRLVATLAVASPVFHYTGNFDVQMAVRNLYLETRGIGGTGLSMWAGSRMYRGDDIYLLDYWPLDNLNTAGGGARYDFSPNTYVAAHFGLSQPSSDFFLQSVNRAQPFNDPGAANVLILNRQKVIGSLKLSHILRVGETGGVKGVLYSEAHQLPEGQRQIQPGQYEAMPANVGFVVGAQVGAFTGKRDTHVNLFFRYATGLAAYGDFTTPTQLGPDRTTSGAHELVLALGANYEIGAFGLMAGGYLRSFRNASPGLDFHDVDEGIFALRPHVFFGDLGGLALEGSFQMQQRGTVAAGADAAQSSGPLTPRLWRFGVIPFLSPAGRGSFSRPQLRLIYALTSRNQAAKSLYPQDDAFSLHDIEHFFGFGVEWWFNSSSYGG